MGNHGETKSTSTASPGHPHGQAEDTIPEDAVRLCYHWVSFAFFSVFFSSLFFCITSLTMIERAGASLNANLRLEAKPGHNIVMAAAVGGFVCFIYRAAVIIASGSKIKDKLPV
ncbi:hypothetical protein B0T26DRAFT_226303 [Lasiosphaeria miniovina]|uniref:Uncharacterized protein n=1 Tax=Lasiosphaeria miniovina TaxID=1954250 RepID=A0AA40E4V1_9PEZI|nr:uncharacterized protein B0T26DRAFT_226303 [Lasiosphaeria miniovina]KAK0722568.1 hypothetical protein B0T26DRAFT_226303 [Lasiosphaeria miniovina]